MKPTINTIARTAAFCFVLAQGTMLSTATVSAASYDIALTDHLMTLPTARLEQALQRSFQGSGLATQINDAKRAVATQGAVMDQFKNAEEAADDERTRQNARKNWIKAHLALVDLQDNLEGLRDRKEVDYGKALDKVEAKEKRKSRRRGRKSSVAEKSREELRKWMGSAKPLPETYVIHGGNAKVFADNLQGIRENDLLIAELERSIAEDEVQIQHLNNLSPLTTLEWVEQQRAISELKRRKIAQRKRIADLTRQKLVQIAKRQVQDLTPVTTVEGKTEEPYSPARLARSLLND